MPKLKLQQALAVFPPDGRPMKILDIDALREAEVQIEAGYVLAAGLRLMTGQQFQMFRAARNLLAGAVANRNGEYALVRMADVRGLLQVINDNWGSEDRAEALLQVQGKPQ